MPDYGVNYAPSTGYPIQAIAAPPAEWKAGGISLDWSTVAAVSGADVTTPEGIVVKIGQKYLRYGQVLCEIAPREQQTITVVADGGTFTLTFSGQTTAAIAFDATAAAVQAALVALSNIAAGDVIVTGAAGGPYTVTFQGAFLNTNPAAMTASAASLTGTPHSVTIATAQGGSTSGGKYGPYDPDATDGRQTLVRGSVFILNETLLELGVLGLGLTDTNHPGVLEGGLMWRDRILATRGDHSLAAGPTFAELEAVLPRMRYAQS